MMYRIQNDLVDMARLTMMYRIQNDLVDEAHYDVQDTERPGRHGEAVQDTL